MLAFSLAFLACNSSTQRMPILLGLSDEESVLVLQSADCRSREADVVFTLTQLHINRVHVLSEKTQDSALVESVERIMRRLKYRPEVHFSSSVVIPRWLPPLSLPATPFVAIRRHTGAFLTFSLPMDRLQARKLIALSKTFLDSANVK